MNKARYIAWLMVIIGVGCEQSRDRTTSTSTKNTYPSTGFADYDWLPDQLKHTADHLATAHTDRHFNFYYYFQVDDINRHFYMIDPGLEVIEEMPVTNENALSLLEDKLYEIKNRRSGIHVAWDTTMFIRKANAPPKIPYHRQTITYILPDQEANFSQLRVALVEDTTVQSSIRYYGPPDPTIYLLSEVDEPPRPVRGMDYFRKAIMNEVRSAEVFALYDTGTVEVVFTVWGYRTHSPNLVRGFSSRSNSHAAYQADGEFIKAINRAKVRWHHAQKDDQPVRCQISVTFDISQLNNVSPQPPTP